MGAGKNKIIAALVFIFGIIITYVAYDLILTIPDFLNNTLQTMIFWTGLITLWIMVVLVAPMYLSITQHDIEYMGIPKAIGTFIGSTMAMIVLWNILPTILTTLTGMTNGSAITTTIQGIVWFGCILGFIAGCNILPAYFIIECLQVKKETPTQ